MRPRYPFEPKSNVHLEVGDYWDILLSNGEHAVGVVVAVPTPEQDPSTPPSSRMFVAGVLDWHGLDRYEPDPQRPSALLDWGQAHINTIRRAGGSILGNVGYSLTALRRRSHGFGKPMWVYVNGVRAGEATDEEARELPVMSTWGLDVARLRAERVFVEHRPIAHVVRPAHLGSLKD